MPKSSPGLSSTPSFLKQVISTSWHMWRYALRHLDRVGVALLLLSELPAVRSKPSDSVTPRIKFPTASPDVDAYYLMSSLHDTITDLRQSSEAEHTSAILTNYSMNYDDYALFKAKKLGQRFDLIDVMGLILRTMREIQQLKNDSTLQDYDALRSKIPGLERIRHYIQETETNPELLQGLDAAIDEAKQSTARVKQLPALLFTAREERFGTLFDSAWREAVATDNAKALHQLFEADPERRVLLLTRRPLLVDLWSYAALTMKPNIQLYLLKYRHQYNIDVHANIFEFGDDISDSHKVSALDYPCEMGYVELVKRFAKAKAYQIKRQVHFDCFQFCVTSAVLFGQTAVLDTLHTAGITLDLHRILDAYIKSGLIKDKQGSVIFGKLLRTLSVHPKVNVHALSSQNETVLAKLVTHGNVSDVEALLQISVNMYQETYRNNASYFPIKLAFDLNKLDMIEAFLAHGFNISKKDSYDQRLVQFVGATIPFYSLYWNTPSTILALKEKNLTQALYADFEKYIDYRLGTLVLRITSPSMMFPAMLLFFVIFSVTWKYLIKKCGPVKALPKPEETPVVVKHNTVGQSYKKPPAPLLTPMTNPNPWISQPIVDDERKKKTVIMPEASKVSKREEVKNQVVAAIANRKLARIIEQDREKEKLLRPERTELQTPTPPRVTPPVQVADEQKNSVDHNEEKHVRSQPSATQQVAASTQQGERDNVKPNAYAEFAYHHLEQIIWLHIQHEMEEKSASHEYQGVNNLVRHMAGIYHLHRFNLARKKNLAVTTKDVAELEISGFIRTMMAHRGAIASSFATMMATAKVCCDVLPHYVARMRKVHSVRPAFTEEKMESLARLAGADLSTPTLVSFESLPVMQEIQAYFAEIEARELDPKASIDDRVYLEWVSHRFIPIINRVAEHFEKARFNAAYITENFCEHLAALRMLMTLCGEYYNPNRANRFQRNPAINRDLIDFLSDCHHVRNRVAHHFTDVSDALILDLCKKSLVLSSIAPLENLDLSFTGLRLKSKFFASRQNNSVPMSQSTQTEQHGM